MTIHKKRSNWRWWKPFTKPDQFLYLIELPISSTSRRFELLVHDVMSGDLAILGRYRSKWQALVCHNIWWHYLACDDWLWSYEDCIDEL